MRVYRSVSLLSLAALTCAAAPSPAAIEADAGAAIGAVTTPAKADPVHGRALAAECSVCHDGDGRTRLDIYPRIAGQTYDYLLLSLQEFRSKERHQQYASLMWPSVQPLSDQDLRDLAAYYSALPW